MSTAELYIQKRREKGLRKGIEKGIEKGQIAMCRNSILQVLKGRFGRVPRGLKEAVGAKDSLPKLQALLRAAVRCPDLESFASRL